MANIVYLNGRLTKDPDVRYNGEMAMARFTLAVDRQNKEKDTDFIGCKCFGKTAELVEKYIGKGRLIGVAGRIQTGKYDKDGRTIYTTDVIADRVEFLDKAKEESNPRDDAPQGFSQLSEDIPFERGNMGYAHGIRWTKDKIDQEISEVMNYLGIDRMPSKTEMENYYMNSALTNKLCKTGGFYKYAKEHGLKIKYSESRLGIEYENLINDALLKRGYDVKLTTTKFPYDILVNNRVKVDVKVGRKVKTGESDYYTFNLEKLIQTCDVYVAVALGRNNGRNEIYVIPSSIMSGKTQLSIGAQKSAYDKYIDRWDIVKALDEAFILIESQ